MPSESEMSFKRLQALRLVDAHRQRSYFREINRRARLEPKAKTPWLVEAQGACADWATGDNRSALGPPKKIRHG